LCCSQENVSQILKKITNVPNYRPKTVIHALYINRGEWYKRNIKAIRNYEAKFHWHQPPKRRIPTEKLIKKAITGDEDALERMEEQCRPAGWPPSKAVFINEDSIDPSERFFSRQNVFGQVSADKDSPRLSLTGESGLNWGLGANRIDVDNCPDCLELLRIKEYPLSPTPYAKPMAKSNYIKCPACGEKFKKCTNKNCQRFLSLDVKYCYKCHTEQPEAFMPSWVNPISISFISRYK
jgi:hypothetical protein